MMAVLSRPSDSPSGTAMFGELVTWDCWGSVSISFQLGNIDGMGRNILKPSTIHHLFKIDLAVINSCREAGIVTLEAACLKWNTDDSLDFGLSICVFFGVCVHGSMWFLLDVHV